MNSSHLGPTWVDPRSPALPTPAWPAPAHPPVRPASLWLRTLAAVWKWVWGALLSTFFLGGFLVAGWTARAARRQTLLTWWRRSPVRASGQSFHEFLAQDPALAEWVTWPRWILGTPAGSASVSHPGQPGPLRRAWSRAFGGLLANARLGLAMIATTAVVTLPGALLWATAWYAGWQNSFNKGYENAWFGPTMYFLGMGLFSVAMLYVPLAQARLASTGDWRRFFDTQVVMTLIRRRWLASAGLAVIWGLVSGGALILKTLPAFAQYVPDLADLSPAEALKQSQDFFFLAALVFFPAYVLLRLLAARIYASGLRDAFQSGALGEESLGPEEWRSLNRLGLLTPLGQAAPGRFLRLARWLATRAGQITAATVVFAGWFAFSFLVAVSEFAARTELGRGWWNQPMIQVPWFDYTPGRLRALARENPGTEVPTPSETLPSETAVPDLPTDADR